MNFEDEPYVRLYTRKTVTFKRIGWEGRTVLWHLMIEADRAGVVALGDEDEVSAVMVLTDLPEDIVSRGLSALASRCVTERHGTSLVITRFLEAQEARRSDKERARAYRTRRRENVTQCDKTVTQCDAPSQNVTAITKRHSPSASTSALAEDPPTPLPECDRPRDRLAESFEGTFEVQQLFDAWKVAVGLPEAELRRPYDVRSDHLKSAIKTYGMSKCLIVANCCMNDGMVSGKTDEKRKPHKTVEYIFGNASTFERILHAAPQATTQRKISPGEQLRRHLESDQ